MRPCPFPINPLAHGTVHLFNCRPRASRTRQALSSLRRLAIFSVSRRHAIQSPFRHRSLQPQSHLSYRTTHMSLVLPLNTTATHRQLLFVCVQYAFLTQLIFYQQPGGNAQGSRRVLAIHNLPREFPQLQNADLVPTIRTSTSKSFGAVTMRAWAVPDLSDQCLLYIRTLIRSKCTTPDDERGEATTNPSLWSYLKARPPPITRPHDIETKHNILYDYDDCYNRGNRECENETSCQERGASVKVKTKGKFGITYATAGS